MIDQRFKVEVDGVDVTSKVEKCRISREEGRVYNLASFSMGDQLQKMQNVIITMDSFTFRGFISAVDKTTKNMYTIECRSNNAKLTTPITQPEEVLDPATTSHALMDYYAVETGVPITIDSIDLNLGIGYERNGTMLEAITAIAGVTKSDIYDTGNGLKITPRKSISTTGIPVKESDIFNFVSTRSDIINNGVGTVIIKTSADDGTGEGYNALDSSFCAADIDNSNGSVIVRINPIDILSETRGLTTNFAGVLTKMQMLKTEAIRSTEFYLDTAVESDADILSVRVDGVDISYTLNEGTNYISFPVEQRGVIEVQYYGSIFASNVVTISGGFYHIDLVDTQTKVYYYQGKLSTNDDDRQVTAGGLSVYAPRYMSYSQGYTVSVVGGDITPTFTYDNQPITIAYTRAEEEIILSESSNILYDGTDYYATVVNAIKEIVSVKARGEEVLYTLDGDRLVFSEDYRQVVVVYKADAVRYHVKDGTVSFDYITMHMDDLEFRAEGYNPDDYRTYPPELPQYIPINLPTELGTFVSDVLGKTYDVKRPNGTTINYTPDDTGLIRIYVESPGQYSIDTSPAIPGSYMILTVGGC